MACSLSGLKARMPRIANFSIWDMVAFVLRRRAGFGLNYGFSQLTRGGGVWRPEIAPVTALRW